MNITKQIPDLLRDSKELTEVFSKYKLIPYYGSSEQSSHSTLNLIYDLAQLSSSHNGCKKDIAAYAFGGSLQSVKRQLPGVYYPQDELEVDRPVQLSFFDELTTLGLSPITILDITKMLFSDKADSGNAYLQIQVITVGKVQKIQLKVWHFLQVMYQASEGVQRALVSPKFDENFWQKVPPVSLPISLLGKPFVWQKRGSITETLLHLKIPQSISPYYGLSPLVAILPDLYAEFKSAELNAKIAGTELVSKHLILMEETNPSRSVAGPKKQQDTTKQNQFSNKINAIRDIATSSGSYEQTSGIAAMQYPYGGKAPTVIDFNVNRDTDYAKFVADKAASSVYATHGWAKELTGQANIKAGVGANMLYDLFLVKNIATIRPLQEQYSAMWADILGNLDVILGNDPKNMTIKFPDIISDMIKTFRNADSAVLIEQGANPLDQLKQNTSMRGRGNNGSGGAPV